MTRKLSQPGLIVRVNRLIAAEGRLDVNDMNCPWCEVPLELAVEQADEQQCPECLTSWCYEDAYESELALVA